MILFPSCHLGASAGQGRPELANDTFHRYSHLLDDAGMDLSQACRHAGTAIPLPLALRLPAQTPTRVRAERPAGRGTVVGEGGGES